MTDNKKPITIIIFGASGDLSIRKLYPAFFSLYLKKALPRNFNIIGVSRRDISDDDYRNIIKKSINKYYKHNFSDKKLEIFLKKASYVSGIFEDKKTYNKIYQQTKKIDIKKENCSNKLFYLAVPPVNYKNILTNLDSSNLTKVCLKSNFWIRVLIEKPFGSDYNTAQKLDAFLGKLFKEDQIFRIDHYLAKETIQNILTFRFTNTIFEPVWNNKYIDKVEIKLFEDLDVSNRGSFYDKIGALRDVGQNHIMQMLASVAMENPGSLDALCVRKKREDLLASLKKPYEYDAYKKGVKGQYRGYLKEKGVDKNSKTETYFKLYAYINNKRWKNVPFILESGKALSKSFSEIKIYFKEIHPCLCVKSHKKCKHQNVLIFKIQPDESIKIDFFVKKPGLVLDYEKKELFFNYNSKKLDFSLPDAYEKILFDCLRGDQTLFASTKEILNSWKFIGPILDMWKNKKPKIYKKGAEKV